MKKQIIEINGVKHEIDVYDEEQMDIEKVDNTNFDNTLDLEELLNKLESNNYE